MTIRSRLLIYITVLWCSYTVVAAYHLQGEVIGFAVEVMCADQSEACEDAVEDINGGFYGE